MAEKWIDRGKDAAPSLITPKALELAHAHAQEQRERAERAERALRDIVKECSTFPTKEGLAFRCESIALGGLNGGT